MIDKEERRGGGENLNKRFLYSRTKDNRIIFVISTSITKIILSVIVTSPIYRTRHGTLVAGAIAGIAMALTCKLSFH